MDLKNEKIKAWTALEKKEGRIELLFIGITLNRPSGTAERWMSTILILAIEKALTNQNIIL
ncbi:MAG TPA: hypothetical protein PLT45_05440 [Smithella sp.]|nr:hypothetical protein [Smithella sp.]